MTIIEVCDRLDTLYLSKQENKDDTKNFLELLARLFIAISKQQITPKSVIRILKTAKTIIFGKRKMKYTIEKQVLINISFIPMILWGKERRKRKKMKRTIKTKDGYIANLLINFCKEIYVLRINRDAFSGKRRGYAIQILGEVYNFFDIPEFLEMCQHSLQSKSKNEFINTAGALQDYCKMHKTTLNKKLVCIIQDRIDTSTDELEVTSGLGCLIEARVISEYDAYAILNIWKIEHKKL